MFVTKTGFGNIIAILFRGRLENMFYVIYPTDRRMKQYITGIVGEVYRTCQAQLRVSELGSLVSTRLLNIFAA